MPDTPSESDSAAHNPSAASGAAGDAEQSNGHSDTLPSSNRAAVDVAAIDDDFAAAGMVLEFGKHGAYTLEKRLGRGGIGEVYRAKQAGTAGFTQSVAIKFLRPDRYRTSEKSFVDEARILSMLHHENIGRIYNFFEWQGTHVLVMEYIEGRTLWSLLDLAKRKGRRLSERATCAIISEVADALHYAHAAKDDEGRPLDIVHRDVTPTNILITESGRTKLVDFGVAWSKLEGRAETSSSLPIKGKLPYLSPEQVENKRLDGRSDLCALGSILVEMLTGQSPFAADVPFVTLRFIAKVTPEYVDSVTPGVSRRMKAICKRLLAREPSKRFANGREVVEALCEYAGRYHGPTLLCREVADLEALPDVGEPLLQLASDSPRQPKVAGWMAFVAALVLAGAAVFSHGSDDSPPDKALMPLSRHSEKSATADSGGNVTVNQEKKLEPRDTVVKASVEPRRRTAEKLPMSGTCGVLAAAATITMTAACPGYVRTGMQAGDCAGTPVREVKGLKLPDDFMVQLVSLNGLSCNQTPACPGCSPREPCPAGNGHIVVKVKDHGEGFGGPLLFGQAHVVDVRETLHEIGKEPREAIGRMTALFTEMRLTDGTTIPVCGVLFADKGNHGAGCDRSGRCVPKEGIPILDPRYFDTPYAPYRGQARTSPTWGAAIVKLYGPPL